jgi:hypothetical protein
LLFLVVGLLCCSLRCFVWVRVVLSRSGSFNAECHLVGVAVWCFCFWWL